MQYENKSNCSLEEAPVWLAALELLLLLPDAADGALLLLAFPKLGALETFVLTFLEEVAVDVLFLDELSDCATTLFTESFEDVSSELNLFKKSPPQNTAETATPITTTAIMIVIIKPVFFLFFGLKYTQAFLLLN